MLIEPSGQAIYVATDLSLFCSNQVGPLEAEKAKFMEENTKLQTEIATREQTTAKAQTDLADYKQALEKQLSSFQVSQFLSISLFLVLRIVNRCSLK